MTREEALKIVRNIYQTDKEKEALGVLIPELAESDDERTREFLINFIKLENGTNLSPDDAERCIAYLEKQNEKLNYPTTSRVTILPDGGTVRHTIGYLEKGKKQKPVLAYDENGDVILSDFEAALFSAFSDAWQTYLHGEDVNVVEWAKEHAPELLRVAGKPAERVEINKSLTEAVLAELSKYNGENHQKSPWATDSTGLQYPLYFANLGATWQKEQKPADISDLRDWKFIVDAVLTEHEGIGQYLDKPETEQIAEKLQERFSLPQSKPVEWSDEDKLWLSEVYFAIDHSMYSEVEKQAMKKYIDYLRYQSQPKQEWSEEEKGILLECISALQNSSNWLLADKLSSLRPQPHWKPSEEQMKWLKDVIETVPLTCRQQLPLESLYADLQKLLLLKDVLPQPKQELDEESSKVVLKAVELLNRYGNSLYNGSFEKESNVAYKVADSLKLLSTQPKPEWSENERQRLKTIAGYLRYKGYEEDACFLESIPPQQKEEGIKGIKGHPDPAGVWKPSDGQLNALKYFLAKHRLQMDASTTKWEEYDNLRSLYDILCTIAKS